MGWQILSYSNLVNGAAARKVSLPRTPRALAVWSCHVCASSPNACPNDRERIFSSTVSNRRPFKAASRVQLISDSTLHLSSFLDGLRFDMVVMVSEEAAIQHCHLLLERTGWLGGSPGSVLTLFFHVRKTYGKETQWWAFAPTSVNGTWTAYITKKRWRRPA